MHPILPERPLPIRSGFLLRYGLGSALSLAGSLAIAFFGVQWVLEEAEGIRRHDQIWATGDEAEDGGVEGQERSNHFIFYSYDLKVDYRDAKGVYHKGEASFDSVWREVDQSKTPVVRYDPNSPDDFALSWAIELGGGRWASFGVSCFGLVMIVGALGALSWALSRQVVEARRCAARSDEVLLDVESATPQIVNGNKTGAIIYRYRMRQAPSSVGTGPEDVTGEAVLGPTAGPPLFVDAEGKTIVALVSPLAPRRPMVIRRDLYPFDFTAEEAVAIRERMEAQRRPAFSTGADDKLG